MKDREKLYIRRVKRLGWVVGKVFVFFIGTVWRRG